MITNPSKQKLIRSFNNVMMAVHNLKADIACEGKKAFMECNITDINELMSLMSGINDINTQLDKVSPLFKSYELDVAVDTHPGCFPIEAIQSDDSQVMYPIRMVIDSNGEQIICEAISKSKFTLKSGIKFTIPVKKIPKSVSERIRKLLKQEAIEVDKNEDNQTIRIIKDVKFNSLDSLVSMVLGQTVKNGGDLVIVDGHESYNNYILESK